MTVFNEARARELMSAADLGMEEGKAEQDRQEANRLMEYKAIFRALLFVNIQHELGVWDKMIGIRKGWKIIELAAPEGPEAMFRRMMGGGE